MSVTQIPPLCQFSVTVIILVCVLLAAGCTSPSSAPLTPAENTTVPAIPPLPVTTSSPIATPAPTQCPLESNSTFISTSPIPHHYLGETIPFRGTTNIAPGEMIETAVYSGEFAHCPKSTVSCQGNVTPCCGGYRALVSVIEGMCGINTWSWDVNTSEHGFRQDGEYIISASEGNGAVESASIFTVSGIPRPNFTLNLPENEPGENALRFSGQDNSGNGPEEKLLVTVSSDSGRKVYFLVPVYRNGTGFYWNFSLNKSAITPYNFLLVNVSSQTSPEIRIERTFLYNNEPVYYPYNPHGP